MGRDYVQQKITNSTSLKKTKKIGIGKRREEKKQEKTKGNSREFEEEEEGEKEKGEKGNGLPGSPPGNQGQNRQEVGGRRHERSEGRRHGVGWRTKHVADRTTIGSRQLTTTDYSRNSSSSSSSSSINSSNSISNSISISISISIGISISIPTRLE